MTDTNIIEQEIFTDKSVRVTTARIIIGNTTYALRNITSVKTTKTPPNSGCAIMFLFLSILGLIVGMVIPIINPLFNFNNHVVLGILISSAIVLALSIIWLRSLKTSYHLKITNTAGEIDALSSFNKVYISTIANKINEAIVKCR